jgi:hypothetical protein
MSRDRGRLGTSRVTTGTSIYRGTERGDSQVRRGTSTRTNRGYVAPRSRTNDSPRVSTGRSSGSRGGSSSSRPSSPQVKRGGDSGKSSPAVGTKRSTGRSGSGTSGGSKRSGGSSSGGSSDNKRSRGGS